MGSEVNEVINNICSKLGYAASEITPEMARYMIARSAYEVAVSVIVMAVAIWAIVLAIKRIKRGLEGSSYYDEGADVFVVIVGAIGVIFAFVIMIIAGADLVGWIASPKASMVQYVLDAIK